VKTSSMADWEKAMGRDCTSCGAPPGEPCGSAWSRERGRQHAWCHDSRRMDPMTPRQTMGCLVLFVVGALAYAAVSTWICLGNGLGLE
jgi:hypothetical protein